MPTLSEVFITISRYSEKYRHTDCPLLEISEKYDLFPSKNVDGDNCLGWPDTFPFAARQGVYLISDENERVLYVGKASLNQTLGIRLSSYFKYGPDQSCHINDKWSKDPRYLITIAVPVDMAFEAPAVEEYLIKIYADDLPDNTQGTK